MGVEWGPVLWLSGFLVLGQGLVRWGSSGFVGVSGGSESRLNTIAG